MSVDPTRVRELFLAAIDLPKDEAQALLDRECGADTALWMEVRSLLDHHDDAELVAADEGLSELMQTVFDGSNSKSVVEQAHLAAKGERYVDLSELGRGGGGRVTRSYDRALRRVVARKSLHTDNATLRDLLRQEARLLAYLDQPGAVQVFDCDCDGDGAYTMRVLEGETVRQRIDRAVDEGRQIPVGEAVRLVARIAETMAAVHAKGVLHLDLKPANVMLQPYGSVTIIDWGLAHFFDDEPYTRFLQEAGDTDSPAPAPFEGFAGTPSHMPMEQFAGEDLGPGADIYACGTILYELLAGRLPYQGKTAAMLMMEKASRPPDPIDVQRSDVPERLAALCLRMLATEPERRPASFVEVLDELKTITDGVVDRDTVSLAPGEVLFHEGDAAEHAYQILEGQVAVSVGAADGLREIARRGPGDIIGEMSFVSGRSRSATMTAVAPTVLAVVTGDVIEGELQRASPLLARMLRSLTERLRESASRERER